MLTIGTILYVILLLINAMAVLSEDRFLARIGWGSAQAQTANTGFNGGAYAQSYQQNPYAGQDAGVKARLINLIGAVRTLMRMPLIVFNLVVMAYEIFIP
ncbi:Yos1-like protein [Epithele typhae]|uniref:Yos1-like protein n=1 Tax=Epithele typhae TaxID=378194 RepID=UPI00200752D4|nr:Yos1-like protein [Epithele typhae]KAH9918212.1 Yos1-like protein [Epithele typhae]